MNQPQPSIDPELLDRARVGDPEAHACLYDSFAPMVFTLARRMLGSTALAEDVLQDTFVAVITSVDSIRDGVVVGAWIRRIAINNCLSLLRSAWHLRRVQVATPDIGPASVGNPSEAQIELGRMLDSLSPKARAVVWLHDAEGYTHREIAQLMGRSTSFSKSQLARAHKQLRAEFPVSETEELHAPWTKLLKTS